MIQRKVLVVAPYPIKAPHHGGQKRTKALFEYYASLCREVKFVGIFHRGHYPEYAETDMPLGQADIIQQVDENPYASELIVGTAIDKDIHVRSHMAKLLLDFRPDVIHVEQPFLYAGLKVLLDELQVRAAVIYGSQNIEYRMKQKIFEGIEIADEVSRPIVEEMKELERAFSREADLVIAVSTGDGAMHKTMGARRVVVASNGIEKTPASKKSRTHWRKFKREHGITTAVTFIGSGHPPNWIGFLDMIGRDSRFMPEGSKILLGGGIAEYFKATYKPVSRYRDFWKAIVPIGHLEEDELAGLLEESDVILLPITSGGGSNLKTAEAVLSAKKVVATSYAFRGFEKYSSLPGVVIANTQKDFQQAIIDAVTDPAPVRTKRQQALAAQVQWLYCLRPIKRPLKLITQSSVVGTIVRTSKKAARFVKHRIKR